MSDIVLDLRKENETYTGDENLISLENMRSALSVDLMQEVLSITKKNMRDSQLKRVANVSGICELVRKWKTDGITDVSQHIDDIFGLCVMVESLFEGNLHLNTDRKTVLDSVGSESIWDSHISSYELKDVWNKSGDYV